MLPRQTLWFSSNIVWHSLDHADRQLARPLFVSWHNFNTDLPTSANWTHQTSSCLKSLPPHSAYHAHLGIFTSATLTELPLLRRVRIEIRGGGSSLQDVRYFFLTWTKRHKPSICRNENCILIFSHFTAWSHQPSKGRGQSRKKKSCEFYTFIHTFIAIITYTSYTK